MEEKPDTLGATVVRKVLEAAHDGSRVIEITETEYKAAAQDITLDLANIRLRRMELQMEFQERMAQLDYVADMQARALAAVERCHFYTTIGQVPAPKADEATEAEPIGEVEG